MISSNNIHNIPEELKSLKNWVCWLFKVRKGKKTKVPINPLSGNLAKANDSRTWTTFETAVNAAAGFDGIGFMLSESPYVGIDIDHCLLDGDLNDEARELVSRMGTYAEFSPSGSGLHIIGIAEIPGNKGRRRGNIEIYPSSRYLTVTGNLIRPDLSQITNIQTPLDNLMASLFPSTPSSNPIVTVNNNATAPPPPNEEIDIIISLIMHSKQGPKFKKLFIDGDITDYRSNSEADLALMGILPFWCCGNQVMMEAVFSRSALAYREKWTTRPDYRLMTISKALEGWDGTSYYSPYSHSSSHSHDEDDEDKDYNDCLYEMWDFPILGKNGKPVAKAKENVAYALKKLGKSVKYNELKKDIEILDDHCKLSPPFDVFISDMRGALSLHGIELGKHDASDIVYSLAWAHRYNPVCEYLEDCLKNWDKKNGHIDEMFRRLVPDPNVLQDIRFMGVLFKKWSIGAAQMAFNADAKENMDGVFVIIGPQGIGKTRFFRGLCPNIDWACEGMTLEPASKDSVLANTHAWIVELGEVSNTFCRSKIDTLKQFITRNADLIRLPYASRPEAIPRRTAYFATANTDGTGILVDTSGNRRWWVLTVAEVDNIITERDRTNFWGEVMNCRAAGETHHLTKEEIIQLEAENEAYRSQSSEEITVRDRLAWDVANEFWRDITISDLLRELDVPANYAVLYAKAVRKIAMTNNNVKVPSVHAHLKLYHLPPLIQR